MRTFTLNGLDLVSPYPGIQFCDGNQRLAVPLHDPEHSFEYLWFADATSGAILENLEQPDYWQSGEGYRGEIIVCADGKRIFQQNLDVSGWHWRDRTAKGWRSGPAIPCRLEEEERARSQGWQTAYRDKSMVAAMDGATVVMTGLLRGDRGVIPSRRNKSHEEIVAERYVSEFEAEVWSIDKRGKVTSLARIPPVRLPDSAYPIVAVSSGPKPLFAVCVDRKVTIRDRSGEQVVTLELPTPPKPTRTPQKSRSARPEPRPSLRFSGDKQRLVGHFGSVVLAWDTTHWTQTTIKLASTAALLVAVSPNGESIAVGCEGGVVRFFDAATGAPGTVMTPPQVTASTQPTDDTPVALCFSSDGTMCLLGLANGSVAIWDID